MNVYKTIRLMSDNNISHYIYVYIKYAHLVYIHISTYIESVLS